MKSERKETRRMIFHVSWASKHGWSQQKRKKLLLLKTWILFPPLVDLISKSWRKILSLRALKFDEEKKKKKVKSFLFVICFTSIELTVKTTKFAAFAVCTTERNSKKKIFIYFSQSAVAICDIDYSATRIRFPNAIDVVDETCVHVCAGTRWIVLIAPQINSRYNHHRW